MLQCTQHRQEATQVCKWGRWSWGQLRLAHASPATLSASIEDGEYVVQDGSGGQELQPREEGRLCAWAPAESAVCLRVWHCMALAHPHMTS